MQPPPIPQESPISSSPQQNNPLAALSVILGLSALLSSFPAGPIWLLLGFVAAVSGVIVGHLACIRINQGKYSIRGRKVAIPGLVCSYLMFGMTLLGGSIYIISETGLFKSEALKLAETEWNRQWLAVGDSWYTKSTGGHPVILQVRGTRTEEKADTISDADRLNGFEWAGKVSFYGVAERYYAFESFSNMAGQFNVGWNPWRERKVPWDEPVMVVSIIKHNGQWKVVGVSATVKNDYANNPGTKPTKEEIPN